MKYRCLFPIFFLFLGCAEFWPFGERDSYVSVRGTQFMHCDKPYYFVGTNLWYAPYLGSPGIGGNRQRLLRELDSLASIGITNIRLLAGSERSAMKRTLLPAIQSLPGRFDDSLLLGLDFTISEMAKRKMKAVLFLTNYWEWSGGMAQYLVWADSIPPFDPDNNGWDVFMDFSASFYGNRKANMLFRSFIRSIVNRTNVYSGKKYSEDPAIMSWQLANEPRPGGGGDWSVQNISQFLKWIDETAGFIKSLDTNHLVSTGSEGIIGCLRDEGLFRSAHSSPHIDYMTLHLWPSIWRWFDPQRQAETFPAAIDSSVAYVRSHFTPARMSNKPLVLEEFGIVRDSSMIGDEVPVTVRDRFYRIMLALVYDSARAGAPIAGTNFWGWGGEGRAMHPDKMWRTGDPFTADPPHEPQGMHSVFNTDSTTIELLRTFASRMNSLKAVDTATVRIAANNALNKLVRASFSGRNDAPKRKENVMNDNNDGEASYSH